MKLDNPAARRPFQRLPRCQHCGKDAGLTGTECAHVLGKGAGGGSVIDHPLNLIALGGNFGCQCHLHNHNTPKVTAAMLWKSVARREGWLTARECEDVVRSFLAAPKESYHLADFANGGVLCGHQRPINVGDRPCEDDCPLCSLLFERQATT